ncbi:hypothetical protein ACFE04_030286 [Oxalis oulophora]
MSVQLFNGDARLSTTSGTMMLMNEEIAVFDHYKDRFQQSDIIINDKRIELGTQLKRATPMTLQSLLTQYDELRQGQTYICTANVVGIDDGYPWCYLGCKFCTRRVEHHETSYWCKKCGVVDGTLSSVKESAIRLDDILEDGLQVPQRKVRRPLVFESDDDHDEQPSKKLTRAASKGSSDI